MSQSIGQQAEQFACDYLIKKGLVKVDQNYRCKLGEIDLIMRDKLYLVFIEVRARTSNAFGGAIASVTYAKQQKIMKTALHFLMIKNWQDKYPTRFDVITLDGRPQQITWIKDAFGIN